MVTERWPGHRHCRDFILHRALVREHIPPVFAWHHGTPQSGPGWPELGGAATSWPPGAQTPLATSSALLHLQSLARRQGAERDGVLGEVTDRMGLSQPLCGPAASRCPALQGRQWDEQTSCLMLRKWLSARPSWHWTGQALKGAAGRVAAAGCRELRVPSWSSRCHLPCQCVPRAESRLHLPHPDLWEENCIWESSSVPECVCDACFCPS